MMITFKVLLTLTVSLISCIFTCIRFGLKLFKSFFRYFLNKIEELTFFIVTRKEKKKQKCFFLQSSPCKISFFFLEILMDACMRSFHQNQLIGISCISYWQSTILDTSRISNTNTGAYAFLLNSDGNFLLIIPLINNLFSVSQKPIMTSSR